MGILRERERETIMDGGGGRPRIFRTQDLDRRGIGRIPLHVLKSQYDNQSRKTEPSLGGPGPLPEPDPNLPPITEPTPEPTPPEVVAPPPVTGPAPPPAPVPEPVPEPTPEPAPILDVPPTPPPSETPGVIAPPEQLTPDTAEQVDPDSLSGVAIGDTGVTTREVTADELVSNQLNTLLSGDSKFIMNARRRAAELSNRRGQFTSSLFAGAAERAAIESALPIAQNDAQAFRDAATQNLVARNQNAIANIQRAAQLDTALLNSKTSINMANLDAATRVGMANLNALTSVNIANLDADTRIKVTNMTNATQMLMQGIQNDLDLTMQSRALTHDAAMTKFRISGQLRIANIDAGARMAVAAAGFASQAALQAADVEGRLRINEALNDYNIEKDAKDKLFIRRQEHANMAMQAQTNYITLLGSYTGKKMGKKAARRLQEQADRSLIAAMGLINGLYPDQPPIQVKFGTPGKGG